MRTTENEQAPIRHALYNGHTVAVIGNYKGYKIILMEYQACLVPPFMLTPCIKAYAEDLED